MTNSTTVLTALLHPPMRKTGVPYTGLYGVSFRGEILVRDSRNPECDLALALLARGITGSIRLIDANSGQPRTIIPDIERAAGFTVKEGPNGPRFVKRKETCADRPPAGQTSKPWVMPAEIGGAL